MDCEQKMLIIPRALIERPKLLLIDEISEGLQPTVLTRIGDALRGEKEEQGTTSLLVEQNLGFALGVADRWAVLKRGTIDDAGEVGPGSLARVPGHLQI